MKSHWPFDQGPKVAAVTSRQVLEQNLPILRVVHYSDDASWAFTCGTTNDSEDIRIVAMEEMLNLDNSIVQIADLPPGWGASRTVANGPWSKYQLGA